MKNFVAPDQVPLRPPSQVMRLSRMGSMFPTRLSFLRSLIRRLTEEKVKVTRPVWDMCKDGFGRAVYSMDFGGHTYSLVAISTDLPPEMRTDRVIAEAWDSAYVLYDGVPDLAELDRITANAPRQEAGRYTERDLVLSRANKSVRLFAHVTECLRSGQQPDTKMIRDVGYLMRTTAVYGNGKFGIADRSLIEDRPGLEGPFAAEMLTVWLIRNFTHDLAEHVGGAPLERDLKRHLGVGNSTGLGMAPFLVNHPVLLNNWMLVRETALARVRAIVRLDLTDQQRLLDLADRATLHLAQWSVPDPKHQSRIERLRLDWVEVVDMLAEKLKQANPLDEIIKNTGHHSQDVQELLVSLLIEPFGDLVDALAHCMGNPIGRIPSFVADTDGLRKILQSHFAWAIDTDFTAPQECHQFWYVSEAKQEPRLGERFTEDGADLESPLDIARRIGALYHALPAKSKSVAEFLIDAPEHGLAIERAQLAARYPYGEIQDNLIGAGCLPIDMLRCKLSFFGASKFDPKSDRWTRITLCQGAPLVDELNDEADDWWLPVFGS
tara:strand:- start:3145 stop:4794 length:1650 start_codon:yes stop_codon:yes gene_type:complete